MLGRYLYQVQESDTRLPSLGAMALVPFASGSRSGMMLTNETPLDQACSITNVILRTAHDASQLASVPLLQTAALASLALLEVIQVSYLE